MPAPSPPSVPAEVLAAQASYHRALLALSAVVLAACFVLPGPESGGEIRVPYFDARLPSFCMLKREFGIDCPGCGMTRCFLSASHGQIVAAWDYHPLGVFVFALVVAQVPYRILQLRRIGRGCPEFTHWALRILPWLLIVAILGQWVLRSAGALFAQA